jgi:hypothetical protein
MLPMETITNDDNLRSMKEREKKKNEWDYEIILKLWWQQFWYHKKKYRRDKLNDIEEGYGLCYFVKIFSSLASIILRKPTSSSSSFLFSSFKISCS